jgi:hypothetical protein
MNCKKMEQDIAFIRRELSEETEMQFAEQQIAILPEIRSDSFALERYSNEFFRQLDIICIIVQAAAKYMDRTEDFRLEPSILFIGAKVRQLRENFVKQ